MTRIKPDNIHNSIMKYAFFDGMRPEHVDILCEGSMAAEFKTGDVLFREGQPANYFCLIESGKILLEARELGERPRPVQILAAGDVLGWSWLFPPFFWHFQARAIEPSNVIILSGAHLLANAERDHDFGYELMKRVSQVVIRRLQATRRQLLQQQAESALDG